MGSEGLFKVKENQTLATKTKRLITGFVIAAMLVSLSACGTDIDISSQTQPGGSESNISSSDAVNLESEYYFKDNILVSEDVKIEITDWKVIPAGEAGNEYGDAPIIAFWYNTTNLSEKDSITPLTAWFAMFTAVQDNDPNMVNKLDAASHPDNELLDNQTAQIKQNGTVANAVAYTLTDETTPVVLKATKGILGEELGEQTFEIA